MAEDVIPYLTVDDAQGAIEFYTAAFGAKEITRLSAPDGSIVHAEVTIGDSSIFLADESPNDNALGPNKREGTTVRLSLNTDAVDELAAKAAAAGAEVVIEPSDQFYGMRSGRLRDPFGHLWIISQRIEDMTQEEMQRRADELFKQA
jgi:PhnB protein